MVQAQSLSSRLMSISGKYLGRPYICNPLIGSPEIPEVFVVNENGFDCVTYIETVIARAESRESAKFPEQLRRIRYRDGKLAWNQRNHYMTGWIRNNVRKGLVRRVNFNVQESSKMRTLNVVPGLLPVRQKFSCIPKRSISRIACEIESGDLIFFASTRPHLDIFHCGILIRDGERLLLRHASRSQGRVVEQDLASFLNANRMAGVIVVRPVDPAAPSARIH